MADRELNAGGAGQTLDGVLEAAPRRRVRTRPSAPDRVFDAVNLTILTLVLAALVYPLYFVLISSISEPSLVNTGKVTWYPRGLTLQGYTRVFRDPNILIGYRNTFLYTGVGTALNVTLTVLAGYALSRRDFKGRNLISAFVVFTMLFNGGLIPLYLLVRNLGLLNTIGAMVLPTAVNVVNLIIARTFFATTIPDELLEAARVDGCGTARFFFQIVLPISPAIIAVEVLFYGVFHWNAFFEALIFLNDPDKYPLQMVLRDILLRARLSEMMFTGDPREFAEIQMLAELIKFSAIVVASAPILLLYPFLQRYFMTGVMIGSLKG
ncbi:MAG: carbohydrate ABC transporter permease [Spirochaetaceae bacterium]|nr:carbohydrate ABC transporter permease [Spirochaetaceae bacterium]